MAFYDVQDGEMAPGPQEPPRRGKDQLEQNDYAGLCIGVSGKTLLLDNRVNRNTRLLGATFSGKLNNYWLALFATVIALSNSSGCSDPTRTLSPLHS